MHTVRNAAVFPDLGCVMPNFDRLIRASAPATRRAQDPFTPALLATTSFTQTVLICPTIEVAARRRKVCPCIIRSFLYEWVIPIERRM